MIRKIAITIWFCIILGGIVAYFVWPGSFTPGNIARLLEEFRGEALVVYGVISVLRGFTLLPSTPLVIAGTIAFPNQPWVVLAVSLFGIVVSSSVIYWLADVLGIAEYFETRKPHHVAKIRSRLEHPTGVLFVVLWAFFPAVPTDAVCYVAGSIRMHFPKFIAAVFVGELILCSFYIFSGRYIIDSLR